MRRQWIGLLFLIGQPVESGAWVLDAESLAAAGIAARGRLVDSPGSSESGPAVAFDLAQPFAGLGLGGAGLYAERRGGRGALAVALRHLHSPLHRDTEFTTAFQVLLPTARLGASLRADVLQMGSAATLWDAGGALGAGVEIGAGVAVDGVLELRPHQRARPRLRLVATIGLVADLRLTVQHERQPGLPDRLRLALAWMPGSLALRTGYDAATQTSAVGFACAAARWRLAGAASSHPELGWSQAWTLER